MEISKLHARFLTTKGISTDTRTLKPGTFFFALQGPQFDGNQYIEAAFKKGAAFVVGDNPLFSPKNTSDNYILVKDSLKCLQALAQYHREFLKTPILALTGSNGKTTTKALIHAVLSKQFNCHATQGNLNNHIGVPLTLLQMTSKTTFGVVEMGANHQNEIDALCNIAKPDYGLITNFGKAHLEGFGGIEGVIKGKTELYRHLEKFKKQVFVNSTDPLQMQHSNAMKRITFMGTDANFPFTVLPDNTVSLKYQSHQFKSNLKGTYNASNIAAAIAIGLHFNVKITEIQQAIASYFPTQNRSQHITKDNKQIILDAYNANPTSMRASLEYFKAVENTKKLAILGDMLELGPYATEEHQNIVAFIETHSFCNAFLVGTEFMKTQTKSNKITKFTNFSALADYLKAHYLDFNLLLIKGSRGLALERAVPFLRFTKND